MLDGQTYRLSQSLARRQMPSWRPAQFHAPIPSFDPFPQNTQSLSELWEIMDTMQENRFEEYMQATNGLSAEDVDLLVEALTDIVVFQHVYMPDVPARLPFSTMMSALAVYNKLQSYHPNFKTVIEIGPGCGYTSLFLKQHKALENYTQIEAGEAFYLLQSAINTFAFPARFKEHAFPPHGGANAFTTDTSFTEELVTLDNPFPSKCSHYPWWKLGDVANGAFKFDIVTTNATMMEMHAQALLDYLETTARVLNSDGVMVSQCLGGAMVTTKEQLRRILFHTGFAPLVYIERHGMKTLVDPETKQDIQLHFPVNLGIFIREGHPLFERYYHRENYDSDFIADEDFVRNALIPSKVPRTFHSRAELTEKVRDRLEVRLAA